MRGPRAAATTPASGSPTGEAGSTAGGLLRGALPSPLVPGRATRLSQVEPVVGEPRLDERVQVTGGEHRLDRLEPAPLLLSEHEREEQRRVLAAALQDLAELTHVEVVRARTGEGLTSERELERLDAVVLVSHLLVEVERGVVGHGAGLLLTLGAGRGVLLWGGRTTRAWDRPPHTCGSGRGGVGEVERRRHAVNRV